MMFNTSLQVLFSLGITLQYVAAFNPEGETVVCEICGCSFCPEGFRVGNPAGIIPIPPEFQEQAMEFGFTELPCALLETLGLSGQAPPELCVDELRLADEIREPCGCPPLPDVPTNPPVPAPTEAPVPSPTEAPVPSPTEPPAPAPTDAPVADPTDPPEPEATDPPEPEPTEPPAPEPTEPPVERVAEPEPMEEPVSEEPAQIETIAASEEEDEEDADMAEERESNEGGESGKGSGKGKKGKKGMGEGKGKSERRRRHQRH